VDEDGVEWSGVTMGSTCGGTGRERRRRVDSGSSQCSGSDQWSSGDNRRRTRSARVHAPPSQRWLVAAAACRGPSQGDGRVLSLGLRVGERAQWSLPLSLLSLSLCTARGAARVDEMAARRVPPILVSPLPSPRHSNGQQATERRLQSNPNGQPLWLRWPGLKKQRDRFAAWRSHDGKRREETLQKDMTERKRRVLQEWKRRAEERRRGMEEQQRG